MTQPFYTKNPNGSGMVLGDPQPRNLHVADQKTIPPMNPKMHAAHPCIELNKELGKCSERQPATMLLAGRCTVCFKERQALQKCLAKHPRWKAPAPTERKAWWQFWAS